MVSRIKINRSQICNAVPIKITCDQVSGSEARWVSSIWTKGTGACAEQDCDCVTVGAGVTTVISRSSIGYRDVQMSISIEISNDDSVRCRTCGIADPWAQAAVSISHQHANRVEIYIRDNHIQFRIFVEVADC